MDCQARDFDPGETATPDRGGANDGARSAAFYDGAVSKRRVC